MLRIVGLMTLALALSACGGSGPRGETAISPRAAGPEASIGRYVVNASPAKVWQVLASAYDRLGIPLTMVDVERLRAGNDGLRAATIEARRMSHYVDCGAVLVTPPNADDYDVTLAVFTTLHLADEGKTAMSTSVDATAKQRGAAGHSVDCTSKGTLEQRVGLLVEELLLEAPDTASQRRRPHR